MTTVELLFFKNFIFCECQNQYEGNNVYIWNFINLSKLSHNYDMSISRYTTVLLVVFDNELFPVLDIAIIWVISRVLSNLGFCCIPVSFIQEADRSLKKWIEYRITSNTKPKYLQIQNKVFLIQLSYLVHIHDAKFVCCIVSKIHIALYLLENILIGTTIIYIMYWFVLVLTLVLIVYSL